MKLNKKLGLLFNQQCRGLLTLNSPAPVAGLHSLRFVVTNPNY